MGRQSVEKGRGGKTGRRMVRDFKRVWNREAQWAGGGVAMAEENCNGPYVQDATGPGLHQCILGPGGSASRRRQDEPDTANRHIVWHVVCIL